MNRSDLERAPTVAIATRPAFDMSFPARPNTQRSLAPLSLEKRVQLLLAACDHVSRASKLDPERDATAIAESWRKAHPSSFASLALIAGMKPPSLTEIELFRDALIDRALDVPTTDEERDHEHRYQLDEERKMEGV